MVLMLVLSIDILCWKMSDLESDDGLNLVRNGLANRNVSELSKILSSICQTSNIDLQKHVKANDPVSMRHTWFTHRTSYLVLIRKIPWKR